MLNTFTSCEQLTKIAVRAAANIGLSVGDCMDRQAEEIYAEKTKHRASFQT